MPLSGYVTDITYAIPLNFDRITLLTITHFIRRKLQEILQCSSDKPKKNQSLFFLFMYVCAYNYVEMSTLRYVDLTFAYNT